MTAAVVSSFVRAERAALCDLLQELGPDGQTLCEGWSTHDLAAHLWIRETDPLGATAMVARPLSGLYERRMSETRQRWPYGELVQRLRRGPVRFSVFAIPGVDEGANTTEFFVHHEDVRRAGAEPGPPRVLDDAVEEWMWRRLKLLARAFFRRAKVGVVLERLRDVREGGPETIRGAGGTPIVTILGLPSELMLFAHGRRATARVQLLGEPQAVQLLHAADLRT